MLTNVWQRHFNLLMLAVIVLGLAAGAAVATVTKSTPPAVTALPATGFSGTTTNGNAAAQRQGSTGQTAGGSTTRPLMGSIKAVAADSVTVQGQQGDSTVKLSNAKIAKLVDGSADDLKSGQQVSVTAQQEADGSYTATNIQLVQADQSGRAAVAQGGFAGQSGESAGSGGQTGARAQGQNQGQGGAASNGQSRAQGQGQTGSDTRARPIVGTISSFSAGVLSVTTQQGEDKITVGSARIQKSAEGSAKDLQAGQRVLVMGQLGSDGSYISAEIQILASQQ